MGALGFLIVLIGPAEVLSSSAVAQTPMDLTQQDSFGSGEGQSSYPRGAATTPKERR